MKKAPGETQTLSAGYSKVEPKIFAPPQTLFQGAWDGQNLNRPTNKHSHKPTNRQDRLQYTALCQKHRSCRPDQPSLCSGYHRQEKKFIVRPCGETRWPNASSLRIITGRSSKNWFSFWSRLAATARTLAPFMDPADRRRYTLQHLCRMVQGSSSWPLWVDATDLCCLRDLMMMMMMMCC